LQDVPAPEWTNRPRAKDDLRQQAVALRSTGLSYREIAEVVPVSKSTLSLWLRNRPLSDSQVEELRQRVAAGGAQRGASLRARAASRRRVVQERARQEITDLSDGELFVAGVVAYWAEGAKNKPWRTGEQVKFVNSDPDLIRLFLAWLDLVGVPGDQLVFRVQIHESSDANAAARFWREELGLAASQFGNPVMKRHRVKPARYNTGDLYHGCLAVYVRRSASLNVQIAGWWEGLLAELARPRRNEG
jgi:transcriptional regulator with XRE-family HTH domain